MLVHGLGAGCWNLGIPIICCWSLCLVPEAAGVPGTILLSLVSRNFSDPNGSGQVQGLRQGEEESSLHGEMF